MKMISIFGKIAAAVTILGTDLAAADTQDFFADLVRVRDFIGSDTRGQAKLQLSSDGSELRYELIVESLDSFVQAHIHIFPDALGPQSALDRFRESSPKLEYGPVVVYLTDFVRGGIAVDGALVKGVITESDLVGPLRGYPMGLLAQLMQKEDAYIALHVIQPVPPSNEFCCPVGVRGTIKPVRSQ